MKVLHFTDFHFSNDGAKSIQKQKQLCEAILSSLKEVDFDLIFFTGDLVYNGKHKKWFDMAYDNLFLPILKLKGKSKSDLILCQGNHDINREEVRKPFIKYLDEDLKSNVDLDNFVDFHNEDFKDTLKPSSNFFEFQKSKKGDDKDDYMNELYSVYIREINNVKYGIVCINSAWRSTGDDENKLIFPLKLIDEALMKIQNVDKRVLLHHHPLSYFKPINQYEIEDLIHKRFDVSFYGHIHKGLTSIDYTPKTGIIKIISPATLKQHVGGEIGFTIVDFEFENSTFSIDTFYYDERHEFFYQHPNKKVIEIPEAQEIKDQNSFRKRVRESLLNEKENAKDLFVSFGDNSKSFLDVFIMPVLKKPDPENGNSKSINENEIENDNNNYLIIGDDKCGKTSLLKKIQIELLKSFENDKAIPFYLNLKIVSEQYDVNKFVREFRSYYSLNKARAEDILVSKKLFLLIDNFNPLVDWHLGLICSIVDKYNKTKVIVTAQKTSDLVFNPPKIGSNGTIVLKFENLRKKQIRALTCNWTMLDNHKTEEVVIKIQSVFKQLSIPFNFWTVSLFLWVFKRSGEKSIQNNVGLVNLYIESLLERENLIKTNANFAYEKYIKLLAHLAYFMLKKHYDKVYSVPEFELISFIEGYLKSNPRNRNISSLKLWNYLKDRGIFKSIGDDRFSFRLNGVFEYFLAYYMKIKPSFLKEVLQDEFSYLAFKNEFEIYAGFSRDNIGFLNEIFNHTKRIFSDVNTKYEGLELDKTLMSLVFILPNYERKMLELSSKARSLTFDEQDEVESLAVELGLDTKIIDGIKEKKPVQINKDDISNLEEALFILGRVFRNMDEIDSEETVNNIFKYYVKTICQWGFKIIETSKEIDLQSNIGEKSGVELLYELMSKVVPYLVQSVATDHVSQKNLEGIIKDRIVVLKDNFEGKNNQFELFVLFFMLIDMDLKANFHMIEEVRDLITIPILRFSISLKLNKYLVFNTNEDKQLENYLKKTIKNEKIKINSKEPISDINKGVSEQHRKGLLNKNF